MQRKVQLYIEGNRIELFNDEQIQVTSSIQNINDLSKTYTDFSQSFTVPASDTNNAFFELPKDIKGASETLAISEAVQLDAGKVSVAARPDSPGDNTIANIIGSLQYQKVMDEGNSTMDVCRHHYDKLFQEHAHKWCAERGLNTKAQMMAFSKKAAREFGI